MAVATYTQKANLAQRSKMVSICSATSFLPMTTSIIGQFYRSTNTSTDVQYTVLPGAITSTLCGDTMRFPVRKDDSKMVIYAVYDCVAFGKSSFSIPAVAVRLPYHGTTIQDYAPAWGAGQTVGTSTQDSGWKVFQSTAALICTSAEMEGFLCGPFETAQFGLNFGPTSTSGIDKSQTYMEMRFGLLASSTQSASLYLDVTSNPFNGGAYAKIVAVPIEIP